MTPATVPRPTVPSQLPESFAVCLKAMQTDMNCPVCSRGEKPKVGPPFASFSGLVAHLSDKRDAEHVAWRAQNAELLVQLCVAAKQSTPAQRLARKQMQAAARAAAEQQQQEQRAKLLEKQQATFDNLEAEVKSTGKEQLLRELFRDCFSSRTFWRCKCCRRSNYHGRSSHGRSSHGRSSEVTRRARCGAGQARCA